MLGYVCLKRSGLILLDMQFVLRDKRNMYIHTRTQVRLVQVRLCYVRLGLVKEIWSYFVGYAVCTEGHKEYVVTYSYLVQVRLGQIRLKRPGFMLLDMQFVLRDRRSMYIHTCTQFRLGQVRLGQVKEIWFNFVGYAVCTEGQKEYVHTYLGGPMSFAILPS